MGSRGFGSGVVGAGIERSSATDPPASATPQPETANRPLVPIATIVAIARTGATEVTEATEATDRSVRLARR